VILLLTLTPGVGHSSVVTAPARSRSKSGTVAIVAAGGGGSWHVIGDDEVGSPHHGACSSHGGGLPTMTSFMWPPLLGV
jgi:hypothetical protein